MPGSLDAARELLLIDLQGEGKEVANVSNKQNLDAVSSYGLLATISLKCSLLCSISLSLSLVLSKLRLRLMLQRWLHLRLIVARRP